ncbi:MAG: hypothetical protein QN178_05095 [Armatimonadota bacterium]|nr:hypothetical protein [Armatimonadota bacterium]
MGIKDQVTPEQWRLIFSAPFAAATYVATASGGTLELIKELFSVGTLLTDQAKQNGGAGYGALVDAVLNEMQAMSKRDAPSATIAYASLDVEGKRAEARQIVADAAVVLDAVAGGDGYKKWLVDVARAAAGASRGGFLGLDGGDRPVDAREQAALRELAAALGTPG